MSKAHNKELAKAASKLLGPYLDKLCIAAAGRRYSTLRADAKVTA